MTQPPVIYHQQSSDSSEPEELSNLAIAKLFEKMMVPSQMKSMHPRATHACDQCRRRKTKCSGEQPDPSTTSSIAGTPPQSPHMGGRLAPAGWSALTQYEYDWQGFIDPRWIPSPPSSCPSSDASSCISVPPHTTPITPTSARPLFHPSEKVSKNTDNLESFLHELYQCIPSEWPSLPDDD
ncbi:hypothetical protein AZE42_10074 [Rhizopogon vesiculosus]|uniref:Zn(2)-C6 fungal-type domain-containing protein n=1 Tax=Rhizopogon vesiculosus TaxID=180088 RepID=A0A1J8QF80_9AGAM|nr:hypothetical protein AZE42_10074 [Rhizopogon vesiculosus]